MMTRLSAAQAVSLLHDSGILVKAATLRQWKARGCQGVCLSKGRGYDPGELLALMQRRGMVAA